MIWNRRRFCALFAAALCAITPLIGETVEEKRGKETLKDTSRGFSFAAKTAMPAVVSIKSSPESSGKIDRLRDEEALDNPCEELLRRFFGVPQPFMMPREQRRGPTFGSGFLISSDGYILTNDHVIRDADEITVTLPDESQQKAKLVGRDVDTDLAVVKIEGENLPYLRLGNSDNLEIGDWVIAIGNPEMFNSTLTVGVASAKGRHNLHLNLIEGYIQTDAAINPGNSGGPLLNIDGEVIGVNMAIASKTGYSIGIGFAIPSNIAGQVSEQIIQTGSVRRVLLGVHIQPVSQGLAESFGLKRPEGFLINNIVPDSPASKAELKQGDIILSIDGQPMKSFQALRSFLSLKKPGTVVKVAVYRDGNKVTIPTTLEVDSLKVSASLAFQAFGIEFEDVKTSKGSGEGVVIKSVEAGSPAHAARVKPGSILLAIDRTDVSSVADCKPLLEQALRQNRVLLMVREGAFTRYISLKSRG